MAVVVVVPVGRIPMFPQLLLAAKVGSLVATPQAAVGPWARMGPPRPMEAQVETGTLGMAVLAAAVVAPPSRRPRLAKRAATAERVAAAAAAAGSA